jgi:prepilin-type N-terminal cleavage/methylation domain-containing protein
MVEAVKARRSEVASGTMAPTLHPSKSSSGFTLIEVVVAMAVAAMLGVAVVRFYKDSYKAYSVSEQTAERDQNAHFIVNKFVEVLQQAGSSLPDSGWTVLTKRADTLVVGVNPRGAEQFNSQVASLNNFVAVSDAGVFANTANVLLNTSHVLVDYADPSQGTVKLSIDVAYNDRGFSRGVKDNANGLDSIRVTPAVRLAVGDRIYGYREDYFLLKSGNLIIRPNGVAASEMVLAENIDSLGFTFLDAQGRSTSSWKNMRSASLLVRARTSKPDPSLPPPGYRKISLPMNVILRNRI